MVLKRYIICDKCGRKVAADWADDDVGLHKRMLELSYCDTCAYWHDILNNKPDNYEIIGGVCYRVLPYVPKRKSQIGAIFGSNRKRFWLLKSDGTIYKSNDMWVVGKIPKQFWFEDTAWIITPKTHKKLAERPVCRKCNSIGCYDRYHCLYYDWSSEIDGGFNAIPRDHIVGSDGCKNFININKDIKNYNPFHIFDSKQLSQNNSKP